MTARASKKRTPVEASIADAISTGFGELQSLAEEVREVVDGAEGGRAETGRIQTLGETADVLENQSFDEEPEAPEAPDGAPDEPRVSWTENRRRGISRATRRDNACAALSAAEEGLRGWADRCDDAAKSGEESGEDGADDTALEEFATALRELADSIEEKRSEAEGVEFPGMMG